MEKEALIDLLRSYKENKTKLKMKLKELQNKRLELKECNIETSISSSFGINQDIHSKNQISNKVLNAIEKKENKAEQIEQRIKELEKEIKEIREKVEVVEDRLECLKYREKELLVAYYIEGRTYNDIGDNLYFELFKQTRDRDTVKNIIEKALHKMLKL